MKTFTERLTQRLEIRLSEPELNAVKEEARKEFTSKSQLVRKFIHQSLNKKHNPKK